MLSNNWLGKVVQEDLKWLQLFNDQSEVQPKTGNQNLGSLPLLKFFRNELDKLGHNHRFESVDQMVSDRM